MRKYALALLLANLALAAESPKGVSPSEWGSIRAAHQRAQHAVTAQPGGGYAAANPAQQWTTRFDGKGFLTEPQSKTWQWGLQLTGVGSESVSGRPGITAHQDRIEYRWSASVEEWFHNGQTGLEQGFLLRQRPAGAGQVLVALAVRGSLRAEGAGSAIRFVNSDGTSVVNYSGLRAWDATGRELAARMEGAGNRVTIAVDDRNARYPVTIDPLAQQAYLKASNVEADDRFGAAVAISGDTAVVGAPFEASSATGINGNQSSGAAPNSGAVYVFTRSGTTWAQQAYIKASNTNEQDRFGTAVAISGDTMIVGAPFEDSNSAADQTNNDASAAGAAYVFLRTAGVWAQQAYLKASNPDADDRFGAAVSISGDTAVVGAYRESSNATGVNGNEADDSAALSGAAYVFTRSGTVWSQQAYLKASNADAGDQFGTAVSVDGDTIIVGAFTEDSNGSSQANNGLEDAGAAYIFFRTGTTWSQQAYLKASNPDSFTNFGDAVGVSGDTAVVGSYLGANSTVSGGGSAYVFVRNAGVWSQQALLGASNAEAGDQFGWSVGISGDTIVVGANLEDSNATGVNGSGANNDAADSGAAYVFTRSGTTWTQDSYLKASNTDGGDGFGVAVAVSNGTVIAGASSESSNGTAQANNDAGAAGAAYVFAQPVTTLPPTISKQFGAATVAVGGTTTLAITVGNPNATPLTNVSFADALQNSLVVANPNGLVNPCGLLVTATAGSSSVSLTAATIPASTSCTITVNVTSAVAGNKPNSVQASSAAGASNTSQASVLFIAPPAMSKAFGAASIVSGGTTTLTITVGNPNAVPLGSISFTDTLQNSLVVGTPNGLVNPCSLPVTAVAGSASVSVASATVAASTSCAITVNVTSSVIGTKPNSVQATSAAGVSNTAQASLEVTAATAAPTISKGFGSATAPVNGVTTLTILLNNPNQTSLSPVSFTDTLQSGLVVATPNGLVNPCSLPVTATAGSASVSLNSATLPNGSCSIIVNVTSSVAGVKPNSVQASSPAGPSNTATASVTFVAPPILTKAFGTSSIDVNGTTTLTFTLRNPNQATALSGVGFSDPFPMGLVIATPSGLSSTCGAVTATAGGTSVSASGLSLAANTTCTITLNVKATGTGTLVNTTTAPTSTQGGTGTAASATLNVKSPSLEVTDAYQVRYAANLAYGDSVINLTNIGASSTLAGIPGPQNGNICANVYTYSPDEQLVSCCSCLVTPNGLNSLSVKGDLVSNPLTPIQPTAVVVKILATAGTTAASCNAALVDRSSLASGLRAWGTTLHSWLIAPGPTSTFMVTETRFAVSKLSDAELNRMKTLCGFIQANGSGFGICKSCKVGGLGASAK